jgi:hypothetical protein
MNSEISKSNIEHSLEVRGLLRSLAFRRSPSHCKMLMFLGSELVPRWLCSESSPVAPAYQPPTGWVNQDL